MSSGKISLLLFYAVLIALAIGVAGGQAAVIAGWVLLVLVVVHVIEMAVFFKLCRAAPGSTLGNLLQVFLFGIFHKQQMEAGGTT